MTSKLASLHSGLVARKGEAMPAVSHPLFSYVDKPRPAARDDRSAERRVWPPVAEQPTAARQQSQPRHTHAEPEAVSDATFEQARLEPSMQSAEAPAAQVTPPQLIAKTSAAPKVQHAEEAPDLAARHRMTLRLDHEQHHRLRLAAAIRDQSLQQVLSEALDNHLDGLCACALKDCACLAAAEGRQT